MPERDIFKPTDPDKRWVCAACGKTTPPGAPRSAMNDSACFVNAVLCWAEKRDGVWHAVEATHDMLEIEKAKP